MTTNTGGSAFPYVADADFDYGTGMTLRDYFAAKAMQGVISRSSEGAEVDQDMCAYWSYKMADAMMKERTK
jgi:hypothetical protein